MTRFFARIGAALLLSVFLVSAALGVQGDIVLKREGSGGGIAPTVFPHWFHRIRFRCYACHPHPFQMQAGANKLSMAAIMSGEFCGKCHNGTTAWRVSAETCNRCHSGE